MKSANPATKQEHQRETIHSESKPDKNVKAVERLLGREKQKHIYDKPIFKVRKHDPF